MIIDTSAIVAIIVGEPERGVFLEAILADPAPKASAGTLLELGMVVDRLEDPVATLRVDDLVATLGIEIVPDKGVGGKPGSGDRNNWIAADHPCVSSTSCRRRSVG